MTREEVVKQYGDVPMYFSSYYKYSFSFRGDAPDGAKLYASYGGSADDIYRYEVTSTKKETLIDFWNHFSYVNIEKDGKEIYVESIGW